MLLDSATQMMLRSGFSHLLAWPPHVGAFLRQALLYRQILYPKFFIQTGFGKQECRRESFPTTFTVSVGIHAHGHFPWSRGFDTWSVVSWVSEAVWRQCHQLPGLLMPRSQIWRVVLNSTLLTVASWFPFLPECFKSHSSPQQVSSAVFWESLLKLQSKTHSFRQ